MTKHMKLSEIGRIVTGKTPKTDRPDYYGGDYLFITPSELHGDYLVTRSAKTLTNSGMKSIESNTINGVSVLVGCIGWDLGNVALCHLECATNQQINSITDISDNVNPVYLYYWLSTQKNYMFSIASVTRTPILSKSTFEEIEVPCPDRSLQDSISGTLEAIDRKIIINNQLNDNLADMLRTLYEYWFVQFDFPDQHGKPYRSSGGRMVWNERLKREIPEGWEVASIINNPLATPIKPGVEPFVRKTYLATGDVVGTSIDEGSTVEYETREGRANMQPSIESVWFAKMKASVKHIAFSETMRDITDSSILSTGFVGLQCHKNSFEYLASFIAEPVFETLKDQLAHGATQEAVNNDDLLGIPLLIPPTHVLDAFHHGAAESYALMGTNIVENKKLQHLRDWLLPMLMNGQATVTSEVDKLSFS